MAKGDIMDGTGVSHIEFDREHDLLFNVGRGDSFIQYWQFDKSAPRMMTPLDSWRSSTSQKAFTWLPKWAVDVNKHEIRRGARVTSDKTLEIVGFRLPSKSGLFQPDLYPPFPSNTPNSTVEEWQGGVNKPAITQELRPEAKKTAAKKGGLNALLKGGAAKEEKKEQTPEELRAEIAELKKQIATASGTNTSEDLKSKPTLGYWKIRGLAAQIRYMFAFCGVNFEDKMYECGDAPDFDRSSWTDVKQTLGLEYPNLPYLIDGETKLTETKAIMRYIAKKWRPDLLGTTAAQMGRIEMLSAHVDTLKGKATMPCYQTGDRDAIISECRPILAKLMAAKGTDKWIAGANLSWLDFYFAELIDMLDKISQGIFYQEFPGAKEYFDAFVALPGMAEYW